MRLIDADALKAIFAMWEQIGGYSEGELNIIRAAMYECDIAPTIEPEKICVAKITLTDEQVKEAVEKAKNEVISVIEPERKTGKWMKRKDKEGRAYGACSVCGATQYAGLTRFCHNCGARMKGDES